MDIFMKNLKTIVHNLHSELKINIPFFKKSHVYELVSAYSGYGSYAAYQTDLSFNKIEPEFIEQAQAQCFERSLALGIDAANALLSCQIIAQQFKGSVMAELQLEKIANYFLNAYEDDAPDLLILLAPLKSLVKEGLVEARLLALVVCHITIEEYKEVSDNRFGEYWHGKRTSGTALSYLQSELADSYAEMEAFFKLNQYLLADENIASLPSPLLMKPIIDEFDDSDKREWSTLFDESPSLVLDALNYLFERDNPQDKILFDQVYMDWLGAGVLNSPGKYDVTEKISHSSSDKEQWLWHYVALKHGIDVTEDNLYAINAYTGEPYDDDGPMEVAGTEGLDLPKISESDKSEMMKLADTLSKENVYA